MFKKMSESTYRKKWRHKLSMMLIMLSYLLVTGCSVAPTTKAQTQLEIRIDASDAVNPDEKGRPSPILVRIYELRSEAAFKKADYYSLQDNDTAVLGEDLLVSDEFIIRPGEIRAIRRKSNPKTTTIGIFAGYRTLGRSTWRNAYKFQEPPEPSWYSSLLFSSPKAKLKISFGQSAIVITELE